MIKAVITKDAEGNFQEFNIEGHAGYNKRKFLKFLASEYDIVCAAVSAVVYTALGALDELANINIYTEQDGHINCRLPNKMTESQRIISKIILETMTIGLVQIEASYKECIKIIESEV